MINVKHIHMIKKKYEGTLYVILLLHTLAAY